MTGIRLQVEDSDAVPQSRAPTPVSAATDLVSDDDRSVAADSWSIKSEYGSTLDDEQRQVDATELLSGGNFRASSEYSSDKDDADANEVEPSLLGLQSYWDSAYAEDLANFREHGYAGEIWFGPDVMNTVVSWTKHLCSKIIQDRSTAVNNSSPDWSVLDIGTGNGLLLQEFAKQGFSDLTGTDYSEGAIELSQNLAARAGFTGIKFLVDDILDTKLERQFHLVLDKGTLDAVGLHPDGPLRRYGKLHSTPIAKFEITIQPKNLLSLFTSKSRSLYWDSISKLVSPGGILVITSCNSTKEELVQEAENSAQTRSTVDFHYVDHVRTYPPIRFGGVEGSRVATVAFLRR